MLHLTQARMSIYFNINHTLIKLQERAYLRVICKIKSKYKLFDNSVFNFLQINLFDIIEQINLLAYCLTLSSQWHSIHSVIFIIHLKQILNDFYDKQLTLFSLNIINDNELHAVKKIIDSHINKKHDHVMWVHWKSTHSKDDM